MASRTVSISIEALIGLLRDLDEEAKDEIFQRVFVVSETEPLTQEEKKALKDAEEEFRKGETVRWPLESTGGRRRLCKEK